MKTIQIFDPALCCSSGVWLASTDPASNVGLVFGIEIGNRITAIPHVAKLSALEIDPQAAAQAYRDRFVGHVRGVLPDNVVKGIKEPLSGACTTEIAAFDELPGLLTDAVLTQDYDHILFGTAPTGHTLLLLNATGAYHRDSARQMSGTQRRFKAFSAGSHPAAQVNPYATELLERNRFPTENLRSKKWDKFARLDALALKREMDQIGRVREQGAETP